MNSLDSKEELLTKVHFRYRSEYTHEDFKEPGTPFYKSLRKNDNDET